MGRDGRCRGGLPADGDSAALRPQIAVGPHQGQKALTLQTVPARAEGERDAGRLVKAVGCRGLVFLFWNALTRNRTDGTW